MSVAIIYGSTTGQTEDLAHRIAAELGSEVEAIRDVYMTSVEQMLEYETLIIGAPTWHHGQLQSDWAERYDELEGHDFSGRSIAFFGSGDADRYPDNFQDALGILWQRFEGLGARLVGTWPIEGYSFSDSQALCEGGSKFIGLAFNKFDQEELVNQRIKRWGQQLRQELNL